MFSTLISTADMKKLPGMDSGMLKLLQQAQVHIEDPGAHTMRCPVPLA